jgi:group I intron endonuclease
VYKENKVAIHHSNLNIQSDLKQYGRNTFVFGIIEHCEPEQLLERERYYINLYNPEYNLTT